MAQETFAKHSLHPLLVAVLFLVLFMKPLGELGLVPQAEGMFGGLFIAFIASLLGVLRGSGVLRWLIPGLGLGAIGSHAWTTHVAPGQLHLLAAILAVLTLIAVCSGIMRQVLAHGKVTVQRIEGAVIAYLLIGLIFAGLYNVLEIASPGSFTGTETDGLGPKQHGDFIFFSFVTLTSVGYGDLVPVHPVARSLAILEAMSGQFFIAVVLARLVSLQIAGQTEE